MTNAMTNYFIVAEGCIYPPFDEARVYCLKHQAKSRVFLLVSEESAQFGPFVFVGVRDPCGEDGKGRPDVFVRAMMFAMLLCGSYQTQPYPGKRPTALMTVSLPFV